MSHVNFLPEHRLIPKWSTAATYYNFLRRQRMQQLGWVQHRTLTQLARTIVPVLFSAGTIDLAMVILVIGSFISMIHPQREEDPHYI